MRYLREKAHLDIDLREARSIRVGVPQNIPVTFTDPITRLGYGQPVPEADRNAHKTKIIFMKNEAISGIPLGQKTEAIDKQFYEGELYRHGVFENTDTIEQQIEHELSPAIRKTIHKKSRQQCNMDSLDKIIKQVAHKTTIELEKSFLQAATSRNRYQE